MYLSEDVFKKLEEIREAIRNRIKSVKGLDETVTITIDLSRSKVISLAIDRLHEAIVKRKKVEIKPRGRSK